MLLRAISLPLVPYPWLTRCSSAHGPWLLFVGGSWVAVTCIGLGLRETWCESAGTWSSNLLVNPLNFHLTVLLLGLSGWMALKCLARGLWVSAQKQSRLFFFRHYYYCPIITIISPSLQPNHNIHFSRRWANRSLSVGMGFHCLTRYVWLFCSR